MPCCPVTEEIARKSPLRVLFFEDCGEDIELSLRALGSAGYEVEWDVAVTPEEVIHRVRTAPYDVILSDYLMPRVTGMEVFELMRAEGMDTPFILVTGSLGEEMAVECLKQGVADYVLKDSLARLPAAVRRAREEECRKAEGARAQEALRVSEASYRSLIRRAPCGILRAGAGDGRLLDANAALAGMLGYDSPADLLKRSGAGGIALVPQVLSLLMAEDSDDGRVVDVRWKRKDGAPLLIRLAGRLLHDEHGAPICLEMIAENVTERSLAQQRIEQLNRLYSVVVHANQAIVRIREKSALFQEICRIIVEVGGFEMAWLGLVEPGTDAVTSYGSFPVQDPYLDGIRITVSDEPEGRGTMGTAIRQARQIVCNDLLVDPSMAPWRERARQRSFRSMAAFPILHQGRAIGALTIYAGEPGFFDMENVALLSELAADVSFALENIETERMRQLVSSELDQFFALTLDKLCISDLDGHLQRMNAALENTLGYSAAEMRSKSCVEFVHPEDRHRVVEANARLRSGTEVRDMEFRYLTKDGSYKWAVVNAVPALDRGVVYAALTDITASKQLEEKLRCQNLKLEERNRRIEEANRMKSAFLANMSHELRSPMNGIIGFSELLYDGKLGMLPARPRECLGRIHASASHLLQLINGILDLSKIEAGRLEFCPERIFVSRVVQEVTGILSGMAAEKRIQIEAEIDAGVDEVMTDAGRLRQVLYNYLSNAVKFTGEGGRVVVRVKLEGATEFRLEVSDTGIGISEEDMPRLFVEFQQLDATMAKRYQGTGLGLALTKRIVEGQGGRVGVDSKPGEGSTFFAVLPRAPLAAPARDGAAKVLVIDDQQLDRFLLTRVLESHGYRVEVSRSCAEAYEKCRRERFAAITLDLVLPDGPGWEALARIRSLEHHRHTPVVVISACEPEDLDVVVDAQAFLTKPIHPDRLVEALKRAGVPVTAGELADE